MRILMVLTYYRPHTSGLTIYVERLAKALAARGHTVSILTMQYTPSLPREEVVDNVRIRRVPVLFRISKGCIAPLFGFEATREVLRHDVIHLHLPQFDAAGVALRARLLRKPCIITYHCDLLMPPGLISTLAGKAVSIMNWIAALGAQKIVTYTEDYRDSSSYLKRFRSKSAVTLPPVILQNPGATTNAGELSTFNPENRRPVIAMAARFAAEKGVEVLAKALPKVLKAFPSALVLFAGQFENVLAEQEYADRVRPIIAPFEANGSWRFLGVLSPAQMASFFKEIDVLVVSSLNSTESFGLVQIEAMMNGVPVVSSDLAGVRQPVIMTRMGLVTKAGDSDRLADALITILSDRDRYAHTDLDLQQLFSPNTVASRYEELYRECATLLKRPLP
jgi:glycosyltransferase involved in cell wall biosynthesis